MITDTKWAITTSRWTASDKRNRKKLLTESKSTANTRACSGKKGGYERIWWDDGGHGGSNGESDGTSVGVFFCRRVVQVHTRDCCEWSHSSYTGSGQYIWSPKGCCLPADMKAEYITLPRCWVGWLQCCDWQSRWPVKSTLYWGSWFLEAPTQCAGWSPLWQWHPPPWPRSESLLCQYYPCYFTLPLLPHCHYYNRRFSSIQLLSKCFSMVDNVCSRHFTVRYSNAKWAYTWQACVHLPSVRS